MAVIEVRRLTKRYGERRAVDGLDLDVHSGEVLALLGPNGAGKTTTLEIMEGFRRADEGIVRVLGIDPWRAPRQHRERVGVVLQEQLGQGELTVDELLRTTATYYPRPWDLDALLDAVGLPEQRRQRIKVLSGGQRRRLDVALGVLGRPELLFLDEPTTGLDPEARRGLWRLIRRLADSGATVLLTTHYLDEAEQLADRVAVLIAGRLADLDTPSTLRRRGNDATVHWTECGRPRSVVSAAPTRTVAELAARLGGEIPDLVVARPSLEDVYLRLVGEHA
ncbi:MAG TPA: ABC transporter ATP-binding protein [Jatrophihabitantaceae bacterium]|nr:ABC transporter ATP-binding protein [Jatrophihabitantaceae bacterium]